jgi:dTDP-4-amino-4,6-dideoxygalactose transaminase
MSNINIPFVDLRAQHEEVREQIEKAFADIIDRSSFVGGSYVSAFEHDFANYLGAKEVVGCGNGTDALWLSLYVAGVKPGEAVITVPNTFIATAEAVTRLGATPIFVDIDLATGSMDLKELEKFLAEECDSQDNGQLIQRSTKRHIAAILPVHLFGLPVDMDSLMKLAEKYGLPVVEDTAQGQGARYQINGEWKRAGTVGVAGAFSFYPGKNLGAMGDGGAVATNDPALAEKMRWLRDHGSTEKYIHVTSEGWNSRLDSLQAAILSIKLKKLDEWNARRRQAAAHYHEVLSALPLELPIEPSYAEPIYHLYVVRTPEREYLRAELGKRGIGVGLHYPFPLHLQKAYQHLGYHEGDFPNAEKSATTGLSMPMHPALTLEQIERVGSACAEILLRSPS